MMPILLISVVVSQRFVLFSFDFSAQIIATSAEVTPNGGLVRESPSKSHSGFGIIVICPDFLFPLYTLD